MLRYEKQKSRFGSRYTTIDKSVAYVVITEQEHLIKYQSRVEWKWIIEWKISNTSYWRWRMNILCISTKINSVEQMCRNRSFALRELTSTLMTQSIYFHLVCLRSAHRMAVCRLSVCHSVHLFTYWNSSANPYNGMHTHLTPHSHTRCPPNDILDSSAIVFSFHIYGSISVCDLRQMLLTNRFLNPRKNTATDEGILKWETNLNTKFQNVYHNSLNATKTNYECVNSIRLAAFESQIVYFFAANA